MAHKTLINGTLYSVSGGRTLVDGTAYTIEGGKSLVNGTAYEIGFRFITYEVNGGSMPSGYPTKYSSNSVTTLPVPTRRGYSFAGWYEKSDFSGSAVTQIPQGSSGDKIFYAKWSVIYCTVTISGNSYEGSQNWADVTINGATYTSAQTLSVPYGTVMHCSAREQRGGNGDQDSWVSINGTKVVYSSNDPDGSAPFTASYDVVIEKTHLSTLALLLISMDGFQHITDAELKCLIKEVFI